MEWSGPIVRKRRIKDGNQTYKPEETVTKLRQVEVLCGQGMPLVDAIRQMQTTKQAFYR
jgi:putative transposase